MWVHLGDLFVPVTLVDSVNSISKGIELHVITLSEGSLKNMGELLRKGARMLSESCPECNTPLFQLKDDTLICPMCNKPVIIVSADTDTEALVQRNRLNETLNRKISKIQNQLEEEMDPEKINALLETLTRLLDTQSKLKEKQSSKK